MTTPITSFYLDANATTPVLPQAIAAATRVMQEDYGNPSSTHIAGLRAAALLQEARERATRVLGAGHGQILFTSGATEGIQTAVLSALCDLRARRERGEEETSRDLLLYGATEHKAVPATLIHWNRLLGLNCRIEPIPVDRDGRHDLAFLRAHAPHTALVCTMAANNESGVISDLQSIEKTLALAGSKALWLVDGVQALGKIPLELANTRIDYAVFSGHKLYAPKGIGMLYVRKDAPYTPLIAGGGQESGLRSGTENMTGIAALGAVLKTLEEGDTFRDHATLHVFRDRLAAALNEALPGLVFHAPFELTLPTTLNFSVQGFTSKELLDLFDAAGIRAGSGSACNSRTTSPSHVLMAMGLSSEVASSSIRLSFGPAATEEEIASTCQRIRECGKVLRQHCRVLDSTRKAEAQHGLTQFTHDGANTWLLADAPSRTCIILNPLLSLVPQLVTHIRCHDYRVLAILGTYRSREGKSARLALLEALVGNIDGISHEEDEFGWSPVEKTVTLPNKEKAQALRIGDIVFARVSCDTDEEISYIVGLPDGDHCLTPSSVHYAFVSGPILPAILETLVEKHSLICLSRSSEGRMVTSLFAEEATDTIETVDIPQSGFHEFLDKEPDALIIDVREPSEHALSHVRSNHASVSIPLSRFAESIRSGLHTQKHRPLIFFCRSGARGRMAAMSLRHLGYRNVWNLAGGAVFKADR